MSQGRKSSISDVRRGALKAHVPYRADDLTQGKKTGISVKYVHRNSDGFESFGEVLDQADGVTPPHVRAKRKGRRDPSPEEDRDGEVSMELDDSTVDSPQRFLSQGRRPSAPSSVNRSNASAFQSNRSRGAEYDEVPSTRAAGSSHRMQNGSSTPGNRSKSNGARFSLPDSPVHDQSYANDDEFGGGDYGGDDGFGQPVASTSSPRHTSFTEMGQGEDDVEPEGPPSSPILPPSSSKSRGKSKSLDYETANEDDVEDEIERGLQEIDETEDPEPEEEEVRPQSKGKRARVEEPQKKTKEPAKKRRVQKTMPLTETHQNVEGVRRGTRTRYKPLEFWRNEKVVYGRRESGVSMVPVIKDIIRLPKDAPEPLVHKGRRSKPRSKTASQAPEPQVIIYNPEEGWDDATDPHGVVLDYVNREEVQRRVAFTSKMVTPKPAADNNFLFQKIFGDGEFIAAGQLIIPVGGKKPNKGTKDNTYIFYLIEGAVNLKIHRSSFVLATGGMFLIPRGNNYYLENISQRPAKLFFAQARKVTVGEGDEEPTTTLRKASDMPRPSNATQRSSSAAATSPDKAGPSDKKNRAVSK
ncbi:hypothetical protein SCHPADRAFT_843935 [Schizopora paradoxa]|uniref:CENP-C homolog n=1 Tax=Schizopora paradoxa TaxID=27342 RepID=A0A0H2S4Q9_9AGAM|nr:hypothetical protein SCHPADRAFT_843935 [Schizopora paradoxa]